MPHGTARRRRNAAAIAALVVISMLGVLFGFQAFRESQARTAAQQTSRRPAIAVAVETVRPAEMSQYINAVGSLAAVRQVTVSTEVPGRVERVAFVAGRTIRRGEVLVELFATRERADLSSAKAELRVAELTLERAAPLRTQGHVSSAQWDQLQSNFEVAAAAVQRADSELAYRTIRAPFDGVLGIADVQTGEYLSPGQKLVELTDLSQLYIHFTVPEQERSRISVGQEIELRVDAYRERVFLGKITAIDPQVDSRTRTLRIEAKTSNREGLLNPGMFANLRVILPALSEVIVVPETAVESSLYGDFAFLAATERIGGTERTRAKRVSLLTGERQAGRVAILKGLGPGDRIVTTGLTKLSDGADIAVEDRRSLVVPQSTPRE